MGSTLWACPSGASSSKTPKRARKSPRLRRRSRPPSRARRPQFEPLRSGYDRSEDGRLMHEMVIYGVSFDLVGKQPIVLLKTADGNKFLPIWIGHPEAAAILMKLQGGSTPRPMTHDLVTEMLSQLDAQVVRITVTELRENTFYASITIQQDESEIEESAIEFEGEEVNEEEIVSEFKQFLENVTPDEFAAGDGEE